MLITSLQSTILTGVTLVYPDGPTKLIALWKPIHILWLPPACSATSPYFYLPPHYEPATATLNISLEIANLNMINIATLDFCVWQHLENHQNETQLQHLASIPSVPVIQLYKHMLSGITPFTSPEESTGDTVSIWTLFSHTGVYVRPIGSLMLAGLGIFCCYFFWCQPARLVCQPLQPGTMQYTTVEWYVGGSTHLQMWWQGQTAHKTSWKSWPV